MIKLSVKKPFAIFVAVIIILMLAAVSLTRMTTDLLPTISTPYLLSLIHISGTGKSTTLTVIPRRRDNRRNMP